MINSVIVIIRGGFNVRPLVQWPTRPLGGWALEAPGLRGPGTLNFGLQLERPQSGNLVGPTAKKLRWAYIVES